LRKFFGKTSAIMTLLAALAVPVVASGMGKHDPVSTDPWTLPLVVTVGSVTVDGVRKSGEYSGSSSGSKPLKWYNDHESIYTRENAGKTDLDFPDPPGGTYDQNSTMWWEITRLDPLNDNSHALSLFVEIPEYARRMIWDNGCDYSSGNTTASSGCGALKEAFSGTEAEREAAAIEILDSYDSGSHHGHADMSWGTQTGSEYFRLDGTGVIITGSVEDDLCFGIGEGAGVGGHCHKDKTGQDDGVDNPQITPDDDITWQTSHDYLIRNTECTTSSCMTELAVNTTMSIEVALFGLSEGDAISMRDGVTGLRLHLSDEARGLAPIPEVPVPAAFWLFGSALIGFIGMSRRTNVS
jgi:hypothetical protein